MNGGQVATRGFLIQTLIALLNFLDEQSEVESVRLEPSSDDDKTDIVVEFTGGRKKAVQVKSSQNQIGLPAAKRWAKALKADLVADEYELQLIGPYSGPLAKETQLDGVALPTPKSLDIEGMLKQAAHQLEIYLLRHQMTLGAGSPMLRELMVEGLIGKLSSYSTAGQLLAKSELDRVFMDWVAAVEEQASRDVQEKFGDGTLTDEDALKEYRAQFDRAALQDSLKSCWCYERFGRSLGELIQFMNTGKVDGRFVAKRRADFNDERQKGLEKVYHEVRELREIYTALVRKGDIDEAKCGCECEPAIVADFEQRKQRIIDSLNDVLTGEALKPIRGVNS